MAASVRRRSRPQGLGLRRRLIKKQSLSPQASSRHSGAAVRLNPESIFPSIETALWILRCGSASSLKYLSSPRKRGPITTGCRDQTSRGSNFTLSQHRRLWVPGRARDDAKSNIPLPSRGMITPGFSPHRWPSRIERAQGMPGARAEPAALRAKVKSTQASHHRSAERSGIPCAMVLRFPSCSPRRPGLVASVISAMREHCRRLDISVGISGPHDFAVRLCSRSSFESKARPPHPAPNVRDDRETPLLVGTGCAENAFDLPDVASECVCDTLARRANQLARVAVMSIESFSCPACDAACNAASPLSSPPGARLHGPGSRSAFAWPVRDDS